MFVRPVQWPCIIYKWVSIFCVYIILSYLNNSRCFCLNEHLYTVYISCNKQVVLDYPMYRKHTSPCKPIALFVSSERGCLVSMSLGLYVAPEFYLGMCRSCVIIQSPLLHSCTYMCGYVSARLLHGVHEFVSILTACVVKLLACTLVHICFYP